jgi:phospholipase/carboxylesterase
VPIQRLELAGLSTRIVGPDDAPLTVVMLHGFGAAGDDLVSLSQVLDAPARFVFPAAPLELSGFGGGARAWWLLDLVKLEQELRAGAPRDRRGEVPEGLPAARDQVSRLLDQVKTRLGVEDRQLVIGGFSQGAMVAVDVALHRDTPPAGIVVMSGTLVAESEWQPRMAKLAGVPVFQSHGRHDPLLPFSIAELLRDRLRTAGAIVDWHQFVGGHEIPPMVLDGVSTFLRARVG